MLVSTCCNAVITNSDYDLCPECLEHTDFEKECEEDEDEEMCSHCSGTGEGQYDGSRCNVCNGSGGGNSKTDSFTRELRLLIKKSKQND